jgi:hypothetical protein
MLVFIRDHVSEMKIMFRGYAVNFILFYFSIFNVHRDINFEKMTMVLIKQLFSLYIIV